MAGIDARSLFTEAPPPNGGVDARSLFDAPETPKTLNTNSEESGFLADARVNALGALGNLAGVADMALSLPGQAIGVGANLGVRLRGLFTGADRRDTARLAAEVGQNISEPLSNPLQKLMGLFGYGDNYDASDVQQVMQKASSLLSAGGDWVERNTGGALLKEDVEALANTGMFALGARGVGAVQPRIDALRKVAPPKGQFAEALRGQYRGKAGPEIEAPPEMAAPTNAAATAGEQLPHEAYRHQAELFDTAESQAAATETPDAVREVPSTEDTLRAFRGEALEDPAVNTVERAAISGDEVAAAPVETPRTVADAAEKRTLRPHEDPVEPAVTDNGIPAETLFTGGEPVKAGATQVPRSVAGRIEPDALFALTGAGLGAWAYRKYADQPSWLGTFAAGLAASAATHARPAGVVRAYREILQAKAGTSIADHLNTRQANTQMASIDIAHSVRRVVKDVPTEAGREKVHLALDSGKTEGLAPNELKAYNYLRSAYNAIGKLGLDSGVISSIRENYATHMWDMPQDFFEKYFGAGSSGKGGSARTPYAMKRVFDTIPEGEKAGMVAKSKDAAYVFSHYAHSVLGAIENTRLIEAVSREKTATGDPLIQPLTKAPKTFVTIDNPQIRGKAVNPEIASQMRFVLENPSAKGVGAVLETIADVSKRSAVAASFFHVAALGQALAAASPLTRGQVGGMTLGAAAGIGASALSGDNHPGRDAALGAMAGMFGPQLARFAAGKSKFLEELSRGSASQLVRESSRAGLTYGTEKGPLVVDDAGRKFYDAMSLVQKEADRVFSAVGVKGGVPIELYVKANHAIDDVMWGRMHPGMKLQVWSKTVDTLVENSARRAETNPKIEPLTREQAGKIAATYTNDLFGGLNYTRIANESSNRLARIIGQAMLSPAGRRVLRIAEFAPDWTLSTVRSALASVDKDLLNPMNWGTMVRGLYQPITRGDLARLYTARSALYYLAFGDMINVSMSGKHLWENTEKEGGMLYINWGDGRRMQLSKHATEPYHWVTSPVKTAVGKLGYIVKEPLTQVGGAEYLALGHDPQGNPTLGPPMQDPSPLGRVGHAARGFLPIAAQQAGNPDSALWNFAGMPLYGKTEEQRAAEKEKRKEQRRQAKEKAQ